MTDLETLDGVLEFINAEWDSNSLRGLYMNFSKVLEVLKQNTGREGHARISVTRGEPWDKLASKLLEVRAFDLSEVTYRAWLDTLYREQSRANTRYHKGGPLHQLGVIHLTRGQTTSARRLTILAFIEDMLSNPESMESYPSYNVLRNSLLVAESELRDLRELVIARGAAGPVMHPDDIVLDHVIEAAPRTDRATGGPPPTLNLGYARHLVETLDSGKTPKEKGDALERLVAYLVMTTDGFEVAGVKARTPEYEFDIMIRNGVLDDALFQELGRYLLVECKNWESKVDVPAVLAFAAKLRSHRCQAGILVARHGITGGPTEEEAARIAYARLSILKAYHQDNVVVVVLDESHLRQIVAGETNLRSLVLRGYEDIRFDWERPLA